MTDKSPGCLYHMRLSSHVAILNHQLQVNNESSHEPSPVPSLPKRREMNKDYITQLVDTGPLIGAEWLRKGTGILVIIGGAVIKWAWFTRVLCN
jgi:hypothetical protein